jgi:ribose 5-phosphate isomerase A
MVVIADSAKLVQVLGRFPLPIEVMPFGLAAIRRAVEKAVGEAGCPGPALLRRGKDGLPFVTDGGHLILDAAVERIPDPALLASRLKSIPGVVEHGLFIGLVQSAIIADTDGVRVIEKTPNT